MGTILKMLGMLTYFVAGLLGLVICLRILVDVGGFFLALVGFVFFPVAIAFAPWYALVADGNWAPLIVVYGGGFLGIMLNAAADAMSAHSNG